ncbi:MULTISPECIES: hypothetical protein [unclassified Parafrankia]|nr:MULTISPECIES: hypothetical protein [unclassified Parafrankia]CAI7979632.1 hypothetical protein FRAHR75_670014 [Frankia sp. Hr75.2]SQD97607.1 hypothetical protein FMEAI12_4240003 [Parafrankia sp. Ea1.12]
MTDDALQERLLEMLDHYETRRTLSEYNNGCDRATDEAGAET